MQYNKNFQQKVLELYKNDPKIKRMLEQSDPFIERYLDDERLVPITAEEVLEAINSGDLTKLKEKAERIMAFNDLYHELENDENENEI